jgi:hypothetical protein
MNNRPMSAARLISLVMPPGAWRRPALDGVLAAVLLCLAACTPELNWREVRPAGGVVLMFPCKPAVETRTLTLAGRSVSMDMRVCETQGVTYALAHADMGDPALTAPALDELRLALASKVRGTLLRREWVPPGTPSPAAGRWRLAGMRPDGQSIEQDFGLFVRGTQVFQVVAMAPKLPAEAVETFVGSITFPG